jgi:antitoxin component YwqK of YwqJK toxin-antitoxin module
MIENKGRLLMGRSLISLGLLALALTGCHRTNEDSSVVSQRYVHKYGYAVSKDEFVERKFPGQVITVLKNGVTTTSTYENGRLHGPSTHSFPHSQVVENYFLYNEGTLVKQIAYDISGMPLLEEVQLSPTRHSSTRWYNDGTPLCTEEYASVELVEGQYFNRLNEIESRVEKGRGLRTLRDVQGTLLSREEVDEGYITLKQTFYSSGAPESITQFHRGILHGEKKTFHENGEPIAVKEYIAGKLHGRATFYKNGARSVEIYYLDGLKNGLEIHYGDGDTISQEILWENDKKHGPCKYYVEGIAQVEYYYDGSPVSESKWQELNQLDQMIGQIEPRAAW